MGPVSCQKIWTLFHQTPRASSCSVSAHIVKYLAIPFLPNTLFSPDHSDQSAFLSLAEKGQSSETPLMAPSTGKIWHWAGSLWHLCPHLFLKPTALMGLLLGTSLKPAFPGYLAPLPLVFKCPFSEVYPNPVNDLMLMGKWVKRGQHLVNYCDSPPGDCICILTVIRG